MAKKTPRESIDSSLKRLKADVPADFAADPSSPLHENVQRFLQSGLTTAGTFDAQVKGLDYQGIVVLRRTGPVKMRDGRTWLEILRHQDVEVAVGLVDPGAEDPFVSRAENSGEGGWDDSIGAPLPGYQRLMCTLSELVAKIKRRPVEKVSDAPAAALLELDWPKAGYAPRKYTPVMAGGAAALGRCRERERAGVVEKDLNEGIALMHADGRVETVPLASTQSNYLHACAWMGESIVATGLRRQRLTHLGLYEKQGGTWTSREIWSASPDDPAACRVNTERLGASTSLLAFQTCAELDNNLYDQLIHVWQQKDGALREIGRHRVPHCDALFVDGDSVWICAPQRTGLSDMVELVVDGAALRVGRTVPGRATVVAGRFISYAAGVLTVRAEGKPQTIKLGSARLTRGLIAAEGDRLVIVVGQDNEQTPRTLHGFRWDGTQYAPWFERKAPHFSWNGRLAQPTALAFAGSSLILGFDHSGIRRLALPSS